MLHEPPNVESYRFTDARGNIARGFSTPVISTLPLGSIVAVNDSSARLQH